MFRRAPIALLLTLLACASPVRVPPDVPGCVEDEVRAVLRDGSLDPVGAAVDALRAHDVVVVGEFHRLVGEIRFLTDLIERAAAAGLTFDVGMELLPERSRRELDDLVFAPEFAEHEYWRIVGERHDLVPLDVVEYIEVPRAVHAANRERAGDARIRLVGLSPPCTFAHQPGPEALLDCFRDRDASMAATATRETLSRGRKLLLGAGRFHAALTWTDPDGDAWTTVAGELAKAHTVASLLLTGPVEADGLRWEAMCGGVFRSVGAALGRPYAAPASAFDLPLACVGPDAGEGSLAASFTTIVELGPIASMPEPTAPDGVAFRAIGQPALTEWDRFRGRLMNQPPRGDTDGWRVETARELLRFVETEEPPVAACPAP